MPARAWDALHAFIALDNGMGGAEEISRLSVYRKQRWLNISTNNLSTWDRVLTNHNQSIDLQLIAGFEIGLMGSNASSAAPIFEVFLTDPDLNVRMAGTNALRRIRKGTPINTPL
jgi:hypothetical protein